MVGSLPAVCPAQGTDGYGDYTAWEDWARVRPGVRAGLASSYDRQGGNHDFNHYQDPPGELHGSQMVTAKTVDGPGIVYRFWMPHLTANKDFLVRMYFDGETTPSIDSHSGEILAGAFNYFTDPLVTTFAGGQVCYEPIGFRSSLRIETENQESVRHYYQYSYLTFPPGTEVCTYTGTLTADQQAARSAVIALFEDAGQHPAGSSPTAIRLCTPGLSIPAGDSLTLADLTGPGLIRQLNVRMDSASHPELNGLQLRVRYDDDTEPAIDVSVGHFFGAGNQRALYQSLPLGTDSPDGFYSYWPMPFRQCVRVELFNTTAAPISVDWAVVEYETQPIDNDMGYLHAVANTSIRVSGQLHHAMLSAVGCGHYVGNLLYVEQSSASFWMLEGDEIITVDGTETLNGTGLEDAYNGGYYYNWIGNPPGEPEGPCPQSAIRPLHGILYVHRDEETPIARADQYRWQIADRIPFAKSIEVKIECRYAIVGSQWTSVALWYQLPPAPPCPGDLDGDGSRNVTDFTLFAVAYGSQQGDPNYNPDADFDGNGFVNLTDFATFAGYYLMPCP